MKLDTASQLAATTLDLGRTLRQYVQRSMVDGGINFLQLHALILIEGQKGITMTEFAQGMKIASPTATSFIDRLVKLKWVERTTSPGNRKEVRLRLTASGKRLLSKKKKMRVAFIREIIGLIPKEDQDHLLRILRKILSILIRLSPSE